MTNQKLNLFLLIIMSQFLTSPFFAQASDPAKKLFDAATEIDHEIAQRRQSNLHDINNSPDPMVYAKQQLMEERSRAQTSQCNSVNPLLRLSQEVQNCQFYQVWDTCQNSQQHIKGLHKQAQDELGKIKMGNASQGGYEYAKKMYPIAIEARNNIANLLEKTKKRNQICSSRAKVGLLNPRCKNYIDNAIDQNLKHHASRYCGEGALTNASQIFTSDSLVGMLEYGEKARIVHEENRRAESAIYNLVSEADQEMLVLEDVLKRVAQSQVSQADINKAKQQGKAMGRKSLRGSDFLSRRDPLYSHHGGRPEISVELERSNGMSVGESNPVDITSSASEIDFSVRCPECLALINMSPQDTVPDNIDQINDSTSPNSFNPPGSTMASTEPQNSMQSPQLTDPNQGQAMNTQPVTVQNFANGKKVGGVFYSSANDADIEPRKIDPGTPTSSTANLPVASLPTNPHLSLSKIKTASRDQSSSPQGNGNFTTRSAQFGELEAPTTKGSLRKDGSKNDDPQNLKGLSASMGQFGDGGSGGANSFSSTMNTSPLNQLSNQGRQSIKKNGKQPKNLAHLIKDKYGRYGRSPNSGPELMGPNEIIFESVCNIYQNYAIAYDIPNDRAGCNDY